MKTNTDAGFLANTIRFPAGMYTALRLLSAETGESINTIVCRATDEYVARVKSGTAAQ